MSPEQARGKAVDKRSDIWSFGALLHEMLAGQPLFAGETVSDVLAAVLTREPDWRALPAATPASVRRLLERCLERDPKRRLRDIGEARLALSAPALEAGGAGRRVSIREPSRDESTLARARARRRARLRRGLPAPPRARACAGGHRLRHDRPPAHVRARPRGRAVVLAGRQLPRLHHERPGLARRGRAAGRRRRAAARGGDARGRGAARVVAGRHAHRVRVGAGPGRSPRRGVGPQRLVPFRAGAGRRRLHRPVGRRAGREARRARRAARVDARRALDRVLERPQGPLGHLDGRGGWRRAARAHRRRGDRLPAGRLAGRTVARVRLGARPEPAALAARDPGRAAAPRASCPFPAG